MSTPSSSNNSFPKQKERGGKLDEEGPQVSETDQQEA